MRLKRAPSLTFVIDHSFDAAREVDRLLRQPWIARDLKTAELAESSESHTSATSAFLSPSGWLILDKPRGITSARAVARVKRLFGAAKAGHCGTLDPAAEGVLPIALGEATKLIPLLADASKTYRFSLAWGMATNSDDSEGEMVSTSSVRPGHREIHAALQEFLGEIEQMPPRYSALRIAGRRAYDLARAGESFDLKPRLVCLHSARFLEEESDVDEASFEISCSKGFYVRSLARDLGERLRTCAHVTRLRRTAVGWLGEEMSIPVELGADLRHYGSRGEEEKKRLLACLRPVESILAGGDVLTVAVTDVEAARLRQGQKVFLSSPQRKREVMCNASSKPMVAMREGRAVALVSRGMEGEIRPLRVLQHCCASQVRF